MPQLTDLLQKLDEPERMELLNALSTGMNNASRASASVARCLSTPGPHPETVEELVESLSIALGQLHTARRLLREWAEHK